MTADLVTRDVGETNWCKMVVWQATNLKQKKNNVAIWSLQLSFTVSREIEQSDDLNVTSVEMFPFKQDVADGWKLNRDTQKNLFTGKQEKGFKITFQTSNN